MENWQKEVAKARLLIKSNFGGLIFKEDTHQYFLPIENGEMREYDCVSHFTHQWVPKVDWETIKKKKAEKLTKETGRLVTPDDLTKEWKEKQETACTMGIEVHEFAESLGWMSHGEYERICEKVQPLYDFEKDELIPIDTHDKWYLKKLAAKQFWNDMENDPKFKDLHFVMAETQVYTSKGPYAEQYPNNYAGTFDLLMYFDHPTDKSKSGFVIMDYKTNQSLYNDYPQCKMMLSPFDDLKDENKSHYILQASCYQIPMEAIGLKVIGRRLIHFKDEGGYVLVPLPDVTETIKTQLRIKK